VRARGVAIFGCIAAAAAQIGFSVDDVTLFWFTIPRR
jgi:hypothetical protein